VTGFDEPAVGNQKRLAKSKPGGKIAKPAERAVAEHNPCASGEIERFHRG
jgi:hypothetical protein